MLHRGKEDMEVFLCITTGFSFVIRFFSMTITNNFLTLELYTTNKMYEFTE